MCLRLQFARRQLTYDAFERIHMIVLQAALIAVNTRKLKSVLHESEGERDVAGALERIA